MRVEFILQYKKIPQIIFMLLKNKKILISGLANKYSIAAGIAKAMHREGAELAFTYQLSLIHI